MATIKDAVFKKKGDVPSSVLKALLVNNGGAAITEKLAQFKSPTASTPYVTRLSRWRSPRAGSRSPGW